MGVNILGYSERGMITAICADIDQEAGGLTAVDDLLKCCHFPLWSGIKPDFSGAQRVRILVEQSFSDFGTPDIVVLVDKAGDEKHAISIEAKVRAGRKLERGIGGRWDLFQRFLEESKRGSSALFWQMYRQQQLASQLLDPSLEISSRSRPKRWKLGDNVVVRQAAELVRPYAHSFWVVALLPESAEQLEDFYQTTIKQHIATGESLPGWNPQRWGYMTWKQIRHLVAASPDRWARSREAFDWNRDQIDYET